MASDDDGLGPISYLVVEFPGSKMTGEGLPALVDLVDRGLIRVLDLAFIMRGTDGSVTAIELRDLDGDGALDLTVFEGASSGLLDDEDRAAAAGAIEPGSSAAVLLFENRWAIPFTRALERSEAQVVVAGYVPMADFVASLDALETADH
jgi:hypothetical protein